MAPGFDGLPAAEREVPVAEPVAEFLRSLSPRAISRIRLGLRVFEWLPFPWRFSRLHPTAREDFLGRMESSRLAIHHELLLMAKVLTTLGYAVAPRVEARVGVSRGCALRGGGPPEPAGSLGETERRNSATGPETSTSRSAAGRPSMPGAIAAQIALSVRCSAAESPGARFQPGSSGRPTRPARDHSHSAAIARKPSTRKLSR